jgi:hypothetical protein
MEFGGVALALSRETEALLNEVIPAIHDSQSGERDSLQIYVGFAASFRERRGSTVMAKIPIEPWEASESPYFGATRVALAFGIAPGN